MATQEIKDLLLEAGPFARLSATEQRTKLVTYYQSWFLGDYRINTVNNIRASQRLTTHAKLMAAPVGVVLQAILLEASGIEPSSRGLLDVEPSPLATGASDLVAGTSAPAYPSTRAVGSQTDQVDTVDLIEAVPTEPEEMMQAIPDITADAPPPARVRRPSRRR